MANEFIIKNGYFSQGSSNVTGSLTVTAGVTASLQGTASFATSASNAVSASYAITALSASFAPNIYNSNGILNTGRQLDLNGASLEIVGNTGTFNVNIDDTLTSATISATNGSITIGASGDGGGKSIIIDPTSISLDARLFVYTNTITATVPLFGTAIDLSSNLIVTGSVGIGKNTAPSAKLDVSGSVLITGSLIVSGSGYINGLPILTSANTSSFLDGFGWYGVFCSTGSQTNPVANVSRSMQLDTTEHSNGVSFVSGSRITFAHAGVYNIQFSAQLESTSAGDKDVNIWFKKNGTNIARSNTLINVAKQSGDKIVAAWNYVDTANVNDYIEIMWQASDTNIQLLAATATGNIPSTPSVIVTATQVG